MSSLSTQFYSFFLTIVIGFVIGLLFDFYRVFRGLTRPKKLITDLADLLFWIFITAVVFLILMYGNWGEVRLYVFIGIAIGVLAYLKLISLIVIRTIVSVINFIYKCAKFIQKVINKIIEIVSYPIKQIYRFLKFISGKFKKAQVKAHKRLDSKRQKARQKRQKLYGKIGNQKNKMKNNLKRIIKKLLFWEKFRHRKKD